MSDPVSTLTDEEKVRFDLKGYLLFPAVLSAQQIGILKDQTERIRTHAQSLPPGQRQVTALIEVPQ